MSEPGIEVTREALEASCRNNPLRRLVAEIEIREKRLKVKNPDQGAKS